MTQEPKVASPVPLKRFAEPVLGKMLQPGKNGPDEKLVPYLKAGHVQWSGIDIPEDLPLMWASPSDVAGLQPSKGDLLVCEGGEVGRAALVQEALPEETIIQNSLHLIREGALAYPPYLKYAIEHIAASGWIDLVCNKATIAHLTVDKLRALPIPYWTHPDQTRIANFLDEKTARIDALIAEKERLVEKLEEYYTNKISEAIDRASGGFRKKLKFLSNPPPVNGVGVAGEFDEPTWPRYIRITDIKSLTELKDSTFKSLPPHLAEQAIALPGDLLLASVGASYGKAHLVQPSERTACYAGFLTRIRPTVDVMPEFLAYWTQTLGFWEQVHSSVIKSTIQNFSASKYGELEVPFPSLAVQKRLVTEMGALASRIFNLKTTVASGEKLLREYRSSLISAAVTGQLNIDDFQARQLEEA